MIRHKTEATHTLKWIKLRIPTNTSNILHKLSVYWWLTFNSMHLNLLFSFIMLESMHDNNRFLNNCQPFILLHIPRIRWKCMKHCQQIKTNIEFQQKVFDMIVLKSKAFTLSKPSHIMYHKRMAQFQKNMTCGCSQILQLRKYFKLYEW